MSENLVCIQCSKKFPILEDRYFCDCYGLLEVKKNNSNLDKSIFDKRLSSKKAIDTSGVWRFREALISLNEKDIITHPEGQTNLYQREKLSNWLDHEHLWIKHEGENPSGSFKDRGMTVAVTHGKRLGKKIFACASTGNTSASLASYASLADTKALVFLPDGKISSAKLLQAQAYGATCLQISGDFDTAMNLVMEASKNLGVYLVNSLNPFRIEGQKTIIWHLLQQLEWNAPDWILTPAGNLGNTSAFGKAIQEAFDAGWIDKKPKLASIQAKGANPFYTSYINKFTSLKAVKAKTIASAIQIGNPVNFSKAKLAIENCDGLVEEVSDLEILEAKYQVDQAGLGCEPASACSLAGLKKLKNKNLINKNESVVCILTGHLLKDSESTSLSLNHCSPLNKPIKIKNDIEEISKILAKL